MKLIPLTQGLFAKVDDSDFEWLSQWRWYASRSRNNFYARREVMGANGEEHVEMHRAILGLPKSRKCDHRNGNGLDNQRHNLRECSNTENCRNRRIGKNNSSGFKGVSIVRGRKGAPLLSGKIWKAMIMADRKYIYLGVFISAEEAAKAYDRAALKHHGEFARLNFSVS